MKNELIQFRRTPDITAALEWLKLKTGVRNQSDMIRQTIMEAAERRGMPLGAGGQTAEGGTAKKTSAKKRRSP